MITVVIKTILRPEKCRALLKSLRKFYDWPVVVADDSPVPYPQVADDMGDVRWIPYPEDHGIGACLNDVFANHVETPLVALLDDDFIITEETQMERWLPFLENDVYDLMGGAVRRARNGTIQNYLGHFEWGDRPRTLRLNRLPGGEDLVEPVGGIDLVLNFFGAKVEALREVGWDEALKVFRHEDWFLRAAGYEPHSVPERARPSLAIGYHPGVVVVHDGELGAQRSEAYRALRSKRLPEFRDMFLAKWNIPRGGLHL